jgi:transcription initiation factor IIE alpha subunit
LNASQLTAYERRRLNLNRTCPVCNSEVRDFDEFEMIKRRHRRNVYYKFIHKECAYGKERIIWQTA